MKALSENSVKTVIHSNGSKWNGQEPDTIEQLIEVLGKHDLDIESFGAHGFISFKDSNGYSARDYEQHTVQILGNFFDLSHMFNIEGVYENLRPLINAIEANIKDQCKRIQRKAN